MHDSFDVILIEQSGLLREALSQMLGSAHLRVLASLPSYERGVLTSVSSDGPLLLLLGAGRDFDATLRDVEIFKQEHPAAKVALLADSYERSGVVAAFGAGVDACLSKERSWDALFKSLELVMLGDAVLPSRSLAAAVLGNRETVQVEECAPTRPRPNGSEVRRLSPREMSILHYLAEGSSNKVIARRAEISEATVKVHVKAILRKLSVQNRTQAAIWATNNFESDAEVEHRSLRADPGRLDS